MRNNIGFYTQQIWKSWKQYAFIAYFTTNTLSSLALANYY